METPKIDGFDIIKKLGEGGMASVWKARQISLDRIVAIKILAPHLAAATEDVNRFLKEACSTAQLKHQGIVQVYDAKASKDLYYFVMEYVAGYTVGDWVRRKGNLSESDTLTVIDCIADAMNYAWKTARVVHCDIKPDNIIIDADGTVKVADLGLSYTINAINTKAKCDEVMGTPAYISPEQAEGRTDLDCRSDIYSLGAMMYHMLTGKLIFHGSSDEEIMKMQVNSKPIDARKLNPSISEPVNNLLKKMLKKKRSARPQDWAELRRLLQGQEITGKYGANRTVTISSAIAGGLSPFNKNNLKYKSEKISSILMTRTFALFALFVIIAIVARRSCRHTSDDVRNISVVENAVTNVVNNPADSSEEVAAVDTEQSSIDDNAKEMFEFAKEQQQNNPYKIVELMQLFKKVVVQTRGTKYSLMAEDEVKQLEKEFKAEKNRVMARLDEKAEVFIDTGKLLAAADVYQEYYGVYQLETRKLRQNKARLLRAQYTKINRDIQLLRQKNRKFIKNLVAKLPGVILDDGVDSASSLLKKAISDPALKNYHDKLKSVYDLLSKAGNIDQYIIDSFEEQIGEEVIVNTIQGRLGVVIVDVDDYRIVGRQDIVVGRGVASSEIVFNISDLTPREKMLRMDSADPEVVALVKGIMAYNSRAYGHARRFFEEINVLLSTGLLKQVDLQINAETEQLACDNLRFLLGSVGVDVPVTFDIDVWEDALGDAVINSKDIDKTIRLLDVYMSEYADTEFIKSAATVITELKRMLKSSYESSKYSSFVTEKDASDSININSPDLDLGWRKNRRKKQLLDNQ